MSLTVAPWCVFMKTLPAGDVNVRIGMSRRPSCGIIGDSTQVKNVSPLLEQNVFVFSPIIKVSINFTSHFFILFDTILACMYL